MEWGDTAPLRMNSRIRLNSSAALRVFKCASNRIGCIY
jgi:hypothetical protein